MVNKIKHERTTSYIKHLAISELSSVLARIKSSPNLTGKCFEMPNVSYTYPLANILIATNIPDYGVFI